MAKIKRIDNTNCWRQCRTTRALKIADGDANDTVILENNLADFYKVKHTYHMTQQFHRCFPRRNEDRGPYNKC